MVASYDNYRSQYKFLLSTRAQGTIKLSFGFRSEKVRYVKPALERLQSVDEYAGIRHIVSRPSLRSTGSSFGPGSASDARRCSLHGERRSRSLGVQCVMDQYITF